MSDVEEAANRILSALQSRRRSFAILRDLAKEARFPGAHSRLFKRGLSYLLHNGVIKLHQSGWRSEKRGTANHPKGVILIANLYEFDASALPDASEELGTISGYPEEKGKKRPPRKQFLRFLQTLKNCDDCKKQPEVYITAEKIPCCSRHWDQLNRREFEW